MAQNIIFYEGSNQKTPFLQWLNNLKDRKAIAIIHARLNRLRLGNFGDCKYLRNNIWELRIHYTKGYRIYFAKHKRDCIIILYAGNKKTQFLDIDKAVKYMKQFKQELKNDP